MQDISSVTQTGRLTRDAELKYTSGGLAICNFSIASNKSKKVGDRWEDEAHFFDCVLFGKYAESMSRYLTKGKQISLQGELNQERWEKEGQKRSRVTIKVDRLVLTGGKSDDRQSGGNQAVTAENFEDDIPF
jgi:single-strand DNA-binding protein